MWFRSTPKARRARANFRPQVELFEDRCLMSAGALDPTFGTGGLVSVPVYANQDSTAPTVVQADGKIVIAGSNGSQFELARYNPDGTLDTSYGSGGVVTTSMGTSASWINGIALQSDGKVVAVGDAKNYPPHNSDQFAVARYNTNGTLDTTFGSGGIFKTGSGYATAVAIGANGKIDIAGLSNSTFTVMQLNANGTLDKTFGTKKSGIVSTSFGSQSNYAYGIALATDGSGNTTRIVLAGSQGSTLSAVSVPVGAMAVVAYTPSGALDTTFGNGGVVQGLAPSGTHAAAFGLVIQSNGGIVLAGTSDPSTSGSTNALTLARLQSNGQLDTTFGNSGFAINNSVFYVAGIAQDPNNDLMVIGTGGTWGATTLHSNVAAYLPGGTLDTSFGTNGIATAVFIAGDRDYGYGIAIQPDGKILDAAWSHSTGTLALARFLAPDSKIGSFTANPNPVAANNPVTLSASNIQGSAPQATIAQVAFYLDANGDGILEPGTDTLLGYGTDSNGVWSFTFTPTTSGTFTLFAQALDTSGAFSDPVALTLTVV